MIRSIVKLLNVALFGMVCYMFGTIVGQDTQKMVDNQVQINYAVYKAITEGSNQ